MNKDHILKEIDRTAQENNGIPLGMRRFAKETGIKPSDWLGKYWTKWGDALIEAGYSPNKMQSAIDKDLLMEQVIAFIREIGRFPTFADFRLKAHNTDGFPSHNTISLRLGRKPEMVSTILKYCEGKPDLLDVIQICEEVSNTLGHEIEQYSKESGIEFGYVYLMKSGRFYKIGRSAEVERRGYEIGIKLPETLQIVHKIRTDDPTGIEDYWHKRFQDRRRRGEWFELSSTDVGAFKRRKFM